MSNIRKFIAALVVVVCLPRIAAAETTEGSTPASVPELLDSLLAHPDNRTETVKTLLAAGDPGLADFLANLFKGNVYEYYGTDGADTVLTIAGPEFEREGETWVPLFAPYPYGP
ncbi:MAG TPA: hypothetical protein VK465_00825, partial [Fibrobacteria bacterium]|nr:hypothetical protein [Fibrobacteria bacterium]